MSIDNLMAQAAQAAFANKAPESQADQDALLTAKAQQASAPAQQTSAPTQQEITPAAEKKSTTTSSTEKVDTANEAAPNVKSFEEYLAEKTGGKFKSWDEVDTVINSASNPKYRSEIAERIDNYIANGGIIDENWMRLQTKDYAKINDPIELFREKMKIENPELDEYEIEYELNERYKLDQWDEDDESPLQQAMSAKIAREAKQALDFLVDNQKKSSFISDGKTAEQIEAEKAAYAQMEEAAKQAKSKFTEDVRATISEIEKLKFSPSEGFEIDYTMSNDEKETVSKIVSSLYDGSLGLLDPYIQKNGDEVTGIDIKGLATKLAKAEIFDNVIKKVAMESKAAGAANIVKNQKNINFTAESKSTVDAKPNDINAVLAAHFAGKV